MAEEKTPARPPAGEVAGSNIGALMAPYIGEIALDPRQPSRYATALREEKQAFHLYRDTLRDERVQAALDQRLDAVVSRPWTVEPGGPARRDRIAAEDLQEQFAEIGFNRACRQMAHGAIWYGYSLAEALWEREGGRVRIVAWRPRAPDRFLFGVDAKPLLCTPSKPLGEPLPPGKFVCLTRPGEHADLAHGPGLARWCFWPAWLKRNGLKFWSVALEKFGAPTAMGKYPRSATTEEIDKLLDLVRDLATGVGVAVPEGQEIELLSAVQRTGGSFQDFVKYLDGAITTTILGQSSTTDQGPWRGTAEVQKDVRDEVIAADAGLLDEALNRTIARWLTEWNFPGAAMPRVHRDVSPAEDLDARAAREEIVSRTTGLRPTRAHVEDVYGGEWEEIPQGQAPQGQASGGVDGGVRREGARFAAQEPREKDAIDEAIDVELGDWEPLMGSVIEPVLKAGQKAESFEALRDRIDSADLVEGMDEEPLVKTLHHLTFSAGLSGRAGLREDAGAPPDSEEESVE